MYFQSVKPLNACDAEDGRVVGHMLMREVTSKKQHELDSAVGTLVAQTAMLRDAGFSHLGILLSAIVSDVPESDSADFPDETSPTAAVSEDPRSVSETEALAMGRSFRPVLLRSITPLAAASGFIHTYTALETLSQAASWFRPMMEVVSEGVARRLTGTELLRLRRGQREAAADSAWLSNIVHDTTQRNARIAKLETFSETHTCAEDGIIEKGLALLASPDRSLLDKGMLIVRGATPEELASFELNQDSKFIQSMVDVASTVHEVLEYVNSHHTIVCTECKTAAPFESRTFLNSLVCKKIQDVPAGFVVVAWPIASHDGMRAEEQSHLVRAEVKRCFRYTLIEPQVTSVEFAIALDLKGVALPWARALMSEQKRLPYLPALPSNGPLQPPPTRHS
jgi:hypothetical protein